jgi:hypothetical protein
LLTENEALEAILAGCADMCIAHESENEYDANEAVVMLMQMKITQSSTRASKHFA